MNFLKRCWQNRWFRRLAWLAMTFVTIYLLLCSWLNWKWGRQWKTTEAMIQSEGETLDFFAVANDPIPEAENFCAIPLLKDLALTVDNDVDKGEPAAKREKLKEMKLPDDSNNKRPKLSSPGFGKGIDPKAWADWLRKEGSLTVPTDSGNAADDLLTGLAKHDAIVKELAAGLSRTQAQWTPEWRTRALTEPLFAMSLPHSMASRSLNQALALRAAAAARSGAATQAHEAALIMARLTQADQNDPFLIGMLVAAVNTSFLSGSTWELCDAQTGTAEEFARLESALSTLDFRRATLRAFRSEMTGHVDILQSLKRNPSGAAGLLLISSNDESSAGITPASLAMRAIPRGYFDASAAVVAEQDFKYLIKPLRDSGWKEAREASRELNKNLIEMKRKIWTNPTYMMTALTAPAMDNIINKAVYAQTLANQAVIACALERHRIDKGTYPESLDAVKLATGKPLPPDVITDKPMGYRKTPDGRYMLWSVGLDDKDDGGKRVLDPKMPGNTKFSDTKYVGDWVWDYAGTN